MNIDQKSAAEKEPKQPWVRPVLMELCNKQGSIESNTGVVTDGFTTTPTS